MFRRTRNKKYYIANPTWYSNLKKDFDNQFDKNFEFAWIPFKNKIVLHTDRLSEEELTIFNDFCSDRISQNIENQKFNHNIEISWRDMGIYVPPSLVNKYETCTNITDVKNINSSYKTDLFDGGWGYPLSNLTSAQSSNEWQNAGLFGGLDGSTMTKFGIPSLPKLEKARGMFFKCNQLTEMKLSMPKVKHIGALWEVNTNSPLGFLQGCTKLQWAELYIPECIGAVGAFMGDTVLTSVKLISSKKLVYVTRICANCPMLTSFSWEASNIHTATGGWDSCKLNKESVLEIITALAETPYKNQAGEAVGLITLGIHVDFQNDDEVLAAISSAEVKGWTVTVQWNGTPTTKTSSSTFSLRKPLIYAKLGEIENLNGEKESFLDWGHYVTNWEENGYHEFSSLKEAHEHFNLEFPKETLDNFQIS